MHVKCDIITSLTIHTMHANVILCSLLGVKLMADIDLRARYDKRFSEIKVLEDKEEYQTVYW